ncbi:MAG: hypothetical protein WA151_10225 [Desulfatirhabdiaceae bacterium]
MNTDSSTEILKYVLIWLNKRDIPSSKIALQKMLFFLKESGIPMRFEFEAYSYGPFSRNVVATTNELAVQNMIQVNRTQYTILTSMDCNLQNDVRDKIDRQLTTFTALIDMDFKFDKLELFGSVLYCIRALQEHETIPTQQSVEKEFSAWKGNNYKSTDICSAYHKLIQVFSNGDGHQPG